MHRFFVSSLIILIQWSAIRHNFDTFEENKMRCGRCIIENGVALMRAFVVVALFVNRLWIDKHRCAVIGFLSSPGILYSRIQLQNYSKNKVNEIIIRYSHPRQTEGFTFGSVETVRKRFISSFAHKNPRTILKFAFDDFTIKILNLFGVLHLSKWRIQASDEQLANFAIQTSVNSLRV